MCGINGIISAEDNIKFKIIEMNSLLKHRGPDDEGYIAIDSESNNYLNLSGSDTVSSLSYLMPDIRSLSQLPGNVVMGHRRLAIIDLSEKGHQPMKDSEGKAWIVYNGEIYNYIELRYQLISLGYKFTTNTDTEVILNAYLHWGVDCLNKFNGMWAFAIWDTEKKYLFASRDRFGVKPFYYRFDQNSFIFSSEIKPLVIFDKELSINNDIIPFYILYGNRLNTAETYFKKIFSLQPSHYLIYNCGNLNIKRYYDIPVQPCHSSEPELKNKLKEILEDSVKIRFRSDAEVGTCLSGGFDSSSIVALSPSDLRLNTFSAVWDEPECDESFYIDLVNEKYGCISNKVKPSPEEFEKTFYEICFYQEIPSEGPGLYPQWYVMKSAQGKVKVLLDGQGGDEIFGGYFHSGAYLRSLLKDGSLHEIISNIKYYINFLNKEGIHSFTGWLFPKFYNRIVRMRKAGRNLILRKDILQSVDKDLLAFDAEPPDKFPSYLNNLSYHFITKLTLPTLLHYEDRSSMAHSIESREPFLDYRLVEFGVNLAPEFLCNLNDSRPLFRKSLSPYLPEEIVQRKDKLGFPTPFKNWTKTIIKNYITETFSSSDNRVFDYIDRDILGKNLSDHFDNKCDYSWEIWRLLSLSKFLEIYSRPDNLKSQLDD
ncbi:MAG: asparagine synthase (glutamine-hydrolyzing) [Ignavibacteria bacterium]|nr:asparagine synthase (glutamine-hydrolyzing) [Ignavibacteria bacterium]